MGIPTLIKTLTADGDDDLTFVHGTAGVVLDSTYNEYMFVMTDINPATDETRFTFQVNVTSQSGYDESITSTTFKSKHLEDGSGGEIVIDPYTDQYAGEGIVQDLVGDIGNGSDETMAGILHLFNPSNTTYTTQFLAETSTYTSDNGNRRTFLSGFVHATAAIIGIQFAMRSGAFDGVIQLYGIS